MLWLREEKVTRSVFHKREFKYLKIKMSEFIFADRRWKFSQNTM